MMCTCGSQSKQYASSNYKRERMISQVKISEKGELQSMSSLSMHCNSKSMIMHLRL